MAATDLIQTTATGDVVAQGAPGYLHSAKADGGTATYRTGGASGTIKLVLDAGEVWTSGTDGGAIFTDGIHVTLSAGEAYSEVSY